jgi:hypothetical protein
MWLMVAPRLSGPSRLQLDGAALIDSPSILSSIIIIGTSPSNQSFALLRSVYDQHPLAATKM